MTPPPPLRSRLAASLLGLLLAGTCGADGANGGAFPRQPLTILVPRAHGGASYQVSKAMAAALEQAGVTARVVTRPGRKGLDTLDYYLSTPPNGYTILENQDLLFSQYVKREIGLNPVRDLAPLAITRVYSQLYVRHDDTRFDDLCGVVEAGRRDGTSLTVSMFGGPDDTEGMLFRWFEETLGFEAEMRPITAPDARYLSLLRGQADLLIEQPGDVWVFLDRQLIRPVFSFRPGRSTELPSVEDCAVDGLLPPGSPGLESVPDLPRIRAFFAHPDTPADRLDFLRDRFADATRMPAFRDYASRHYISGEVLTDPDESRAFLESVLQVYERVHAAP